jgi:aminoglycoside phosphotransferase (APT) family kinase protein
MQHHHRQRHQPEVHAFLQKAFHTREWVFAQPRGTGHETYFAASGERRCFIKLGADSERAAAMAAAGLAPPVWAAGALPDGTPILVQPWLPGHAPRPRDFQERLDRVAGLVRRLQQDAGVRSVLPPAPAEQYADVGLAALNQVRLRWEVWQAQVPLPTRSFVDRSLEQLAAEIAGFTGAGLVAAHNDICNANWLLIPEGDLYLLDLEEMSLEDPATDLGALLWWYYPPTQRARFLALVEQPDDAAFEQRMRVRMALHCLAITLPRTGGWDAFDGLTYDAALTDFRAALAGAENPQGYEG